MTHDLQAFREKAATWRNHAALLSEAAETLDRFCLAAERGDVTQAAKEGETAQVLQKRLEDQMGGDVFRFEVKL